MSNKVLFVGTFLSSSSGSLGVSENLAINLAKEGIQTKIVSRKKNKLLRLIDIVQTVSISNYDLIHLDVFSGHAFRIAEISSVIARLRKKPIIITLHGGRLNEFWNEASDRIRKVFNTADRIQTPSFFLKDFFEEKGFEVEYCPNSIQLDRFPDLNQERKQYSLLWVRAFTPIYQPLMAVKVLELLKKNYPEVRLTMVGPDKGLLASVKDYIENNHLADYITITGPVPNDKLYVYYNTHSVFINTTTYESFGVALVEAASCGIPIVSNNVGEIPYIWKDEENVLLCSPDKAEDMAEQIKRLWQSNDLYSKIAYEGNKRAFAFDWQNIRHYWLKIIEKVINNGRLAK